MIGHKWQPAFCGNFCRRCEMYKPKEDEEDDMWSFM